MIKTFLNSLKCAVKGIRHIFKERNFKIQIFLLVTLIVAAIVLELKLTDVLILLLIMSQLLSAEGFNTAIEEVTDLQRDKQGLSYEEVGKAKDIAAGAVLVSASMGVIIGGMLFLQYL